MTPGTRPFLTARLRRALSAPTGGSEILRRFAYQVARVAYSDLCDLGHADEAEAIVQGHLLRDRRERMQQAGHVGDSARVNAAWDAR